MSTAATMQQVPVEAIGIRRHPAVSIAVVGIPNAGKSTLFNRLTGMRQKTANYPGVTVEKHVGTVKAGDAVVELIDLPGIACVNAQSLEERIAVDVLLGRQKDVREPAAVIAVIDATNLYQGLYLAQQLVELGKPMLVALTMMDSAEAKGLNIDVDALQKKLGGVSVYPVVATTGRGINELRNAIATLPRRPPPAMPRFWPALYDATRQAGEQLAAKLSQAELVRAIADETSCRSLDSKIHDADRLILDRTRKRLCADQPAAAVEARSRYAWNRRAIAEIQQPASQLKSFGARVTEWLNQPIPGTVSLFVVMAVMFQAVFAWATPLMDLIDAGAAALGAWITAFVPDGTLASLLSDGVVAGVGSVVVFLPQILILFLFIIILEDSGYLARAAYLMDRAMRSVGLSGQSIIPMISSFACAVPGIMAARVIPNRRDRIATILAAPFMTCSARLPVYALLIAAFVPAQRIGWLNLQGLVLFGLYMLGIFAGLMTALLLRKTALHGPKPPFAIMLPEFRRPNLRTVATQLFARAMVFLRRAGTVIFAVAIAIWVLAYFPRSEVVASEFQERASAAEQTLSGRALADALAEIDNAAAAAQLEQSYLGRTGKLVEPLFAPLGWDWRISSAVIAGFPAREVVIAVLGTVFAVGDEADDLTLTERIRSARRVDGSVLFTLPMVIGLLIFYACCLQCAATIAVIRRETNGWRWPLFAWCYMTALGYVGALAAFQLGS